MKNTNSLNDLIQNHYSVQGLTQAIYQGLESAGKHPSSARHEDLAPVDGFHIRGREATAELAKAANLEPGVRVLDVGSGIGGTARYLASEFGCHVTGIDLTPEYCEVAAELSARLGLTELNRFQQGSALELPFHDDSFDVVWTEHVQMNIGDKEAFYREVCRVLRGGGQLVFHDVFARTEDALHLPVPWASSPDLSFVAPADRARSVLGLLEMQVESWEDTTTRSREWFEAALERNQKLGPPPVGLHMLMGETGKEKFMNVLKNLAEGRIETVQAILRKPVSA